MRRCSACVLAFAALAISGQAFADQAMGGSGGTVLQSSGGSGRRGTNASHFSQPANVRPDTSPDAGMAAGASGSGWTGGSRHPKEYGVSGPLRAAGDVCETSSSVLCWSDGAAVAGWDAGKRR